ncbi:hypothetical protein L3X38_035391 [Prunus dulcis]|uniref:Homeobox protein knotted-1-like 1 n=1 Tax=Prunus dulcis TaxID=3755 RepID=A0AAD4YXR9_PRUDU|nr:hypothetical protein L3X38_035391 [Prunus dulcis]
MNMEDFYRLNPGVISGSEIDVNVVHQVENMATSTSNTSCGFHGHPHPQGHVVDDNMLLFQTEGMGSDNHMSDLIKTHIANHPRFPDLVDAYLECQKVGAPPEMKSLLEEIGRVSHHPMSTCSEIGADPELDEFMESYCEVLRGYKEELSKPFDEATNFLTNIQSQLRNLCKGTFPKTSWDCNSDEGVGSSEEEFSCGEVEAAESQETAAARAGGDRELKDMLLHKYSGYLTNLRKEFLKKRKKGKLPKDARTALLDWWTSHYRWPYPTEEEKLHLSEVTGLDQKQINNWFINQRKRHWKPSEDMRFALMEGVGGSIGAPMLFDAGVGTGNIDDM